MSIKSQAKELTTIAQIIIEEEGLDIKELLEKNEMDKVREIWSRAVRIFDKNNKSMGMV